MPARFVFGSSVCGPTSCPTAGEESYGEDNRVPYRNQRGHPQEDALRRDLTIGNFFKIFQNFVKKKDVSITGREAGQ